MKPNPNLHRPSPDYLRGLIEQIKAFDSELSIGKVADRLGIDRSQFRAYLVHEHKSSHRGCPYVTQYALECWAAQEPPMKNYLDISDDAQALYVVIANTLKDATALTMGNLVDAAQESLKFTSLEVNATLRELEAKQIVKTSRSGETVHPDGDHLADFRSLFEAELSLD